MKKSNTIVSTQWQKSGLLLSLDFGTILVQCPAPQVLHLRMQLTNTSFIPPVEPSFDKMDPEILKQWQSVKLDPNQLSLPIGDDYQLTVSNHPLVFQIIKDNDCLLESLPGRALWQDTLGRCWHYQVKREQDVYFGLGEKSGNLVRNERSFRLNNLDAVGYDPEFGDPLYKHIPFYMKYHAGQQHTLGVFLNNAYPSQFNFGAEHSGYWGSYTSIQTEGGALDLYFLLGPTPKQVLKQYHKITGLPAMPTKASLGYMGSTMYYTELEQNADQAVLGFIQRCQQLDIPISGFHLSSGYTKGEDGKRYTFQWDPKNFPDPEKFVTRMIEVGQVLSPNIKPGLLTSHPLWEEFNKVGAFVRTSDGKQSQTEKYWGGDASFVDFSNPKARELWKKYLKERLIDLGVESIWNDNNEFEMDDDQALCDNEGTPIPANAMRPLLSNQMAAVAYEALSEHNNTRPFVLSRAGYAGLQKYAQTWSGDNTSNWENFHFNIATMLGMSLSGMPFTSMDVGGFIGAAPPPELFLRWVQNAIFHPRFCIHSVNNDNTVTEPWLYPSITPLIRKAIQTRYWFLPSLYAIAAQSHFEGTPVVAPLFYHFPDYEPVRNCHTQFMLGDALMAVALTQPNRQSITVHFPPGQWRCFYTGQAFLGEKTYSLPLVESYSPLFYRAGNGFFLNSSFQEAPYSEALFKPDSLVVQLDTRVAGDLSYYDDDGKTLQFETGAYRKGRFQWEPRPDNLHLKFNQQGSYQGQWQTVYLKLIVNSVCPLRVTLNNQPLQQTLYTDQFEAPFWYFDAEEKAVMIACSGDRLETDFEISLNFQQAMNISVENAAS